MTAETRTMAEFVTRTRFQDLPTTVVSQSKKCLMDLIGLALASSRENDIRILARLVRDIGCKEEATVIGFPFMTSAPSATFVNAAMGHALQLDDGDRWTEAHVGTAIIPSALSAAEIARCDGKDLLTSIIVGYEVAMRVGYAVSPYHRKRGFSPNGTLGVFGAAAAACSILKLDVDQTQDALGSAGTQAAGLEQFVIDGSASQLLNSAHAAQSGIMSALLARQGFSGSRQILEGACGFCKAFADKYDLVKLALDLGSDFQIVKVYFKPYPTCRAFHPQIDALLRLMKMNRIQSEDIKDVVVKGYTIDIETMCNPPPETIAAARLNMPYCLACALVDGEVTLKQFTEERIKDRHIIDMMNRIAFVPADEELKSLTPDSCGAIVTVRTHNGAIVEGAVSYPLGEPENPLGDQELISRFKSFASLGIGDEKKVGRIIGSIKTIDKLPRVTELTSLLRSGAIE
jgi:2-methylcitrate dehydratase PrpD